jgi:hypothetical protein
VASVRMSKRLCLPHMRLANFACYSCLRMLLACACYSLPLSVARVHAAARLRLHVAHLLALRMLLRDYTCCSRAAARMLLCAHAAAYPHLQRRMDMGTAPAHGTSSACACFPRLLMETLAI